MSKSRPFAIDFAYANVRKMGEPSSQSEKVKRAARERGADEDEARWKERLKKIAKTKPEAPQPKK